jgi:hypothetical protein
MRERINNNFNSQTYTTKDSEALFKNWEEKCRKDFDENMELFELRSRIRTERQERQHREAMTMARLKLEYKNVENITSLCKVTIL